MSIAGRLAARPPWLVRLSRGDGERVAGAGMLVDERHVVTCAHVVGQQLGQAADVAGRESAPAREVVVDVAFPFADPALTCRARVVAWVPIAGDQSGDAAVLELADSVELTPAPLACPATVAGHEFSVHGFPRGERVARPASGVLGDSSGPAGEWVHVRSEGVSGWPIEHGFSGAPVFDHTVGAVVGIVALRDAHRSGHLLPVSYLRTLWSWLDDRIGWRLDLDPSLKTHWLPRARGSEVESDCGAWYFIGREMARQAVCDWLADSAQTALVVIGGPGTGKSALLAHLLLAADPILAATVPTAGPRPPVGVFDLAVQVTSLTRDDVVERLASAAGFDAATPQELLVAMRERQQAGHRSFTVLADAVEEAASVEEARRIAVLLRDLAGTRAVRVLAGVRTAPPGSERARILEAFGRATPRVDLESPQFLRNHDIAEYVERRLTGEDAEANYYRDRSAGELRAIGRAVARKARYNFLITQLATRWLAHPSTPPLNLDDPGWEHGLPETIGQAMDAYLDTCGADTALVRRLLTALAFARGEGLPRDHTWLTIADALHFGRTHNLVELEIVFHGAANYLVERTSDHGHQPSYRLYHHALDEHLRDHCTVPAPHRAIATALVDTVPVRERDHDWAAAAPYVRAHLAGHAAFAGQLDDLLPDCGFLLHAEPGPLLATLSWATTDQAQQIVAVYSASGPQLRHADPTTRCRILALDAARFGALALQDELNSALGRLVPAAPLPRWRVRFATGDHVHPALLASLSEGGDGDVRSVATATVDDRAVAVADHGGVKRIWDLAEQRTIGKPLEVAGEQAIAELDSRPVLVIARSATLSMWDLVSQRPIGEVETAPDLPADVRACSPDWNRQRLTEIKRITSTELDGRAVVVFATDDKTVQVWDLAVGRRVGEPMRGHTELIDKISTIELDGRPVAVTISCLDRTLRVWDLERQRAIRPPLHLPEPPYALATTWLDGRVVAVTGSGNRPGTIRVWDLLTGHQVGRSLEGHTFSVEHLSVTVVGERTVAISMSGGEDCTVRMWDLSTGDQIGHFVTGSSFMRGMAATELDGRVIVITGHEDAMRLWDLAKLEHDRMGDVLTTGHKGGVRKLAVVEGRGQSLAVTSSRDPSGSWDYTVRIWDIAGRRPTVTTLLDIDDVMELDLAILGGRPVAVMAGYSDVQVWDLASKSRLCRVPIGHQNNDNCVIDHVRSVVTVTAAGHLLTFTSGRGENAVRAWDFTWADRGVGHQMIGPLSHRPAPHTNVVGVGPLALIDVAGRPMAITCNGWYSSIHLWDLAEQRFAGELTGHTDKVNTVATAEVEGRPVVISGSADTTIRVWDLTERKPAGKPLTGHTSPVTTLATADLNGRPIVFSGSGDKTIRVWELGTGKQLDGWRLPGQVHRLGLGENGTLVATVDDDIAAFDTGVRRSPKTISAHGLSLERHN